MKVVTLIENTACREGLCFEHGLSLYIEMQTDKILFDAGQSAAFADNSEKLTYYVRGGWQGETAENWGTGVITAPVAVSEMHAWLKENPDAFIAALDAGC